jgi:hypothetical protein
MPQWPMLPILPVNAWFRWVHDAPFKVDENLPTEAAGLLANAGHDAVTIRDQRMVGQPDANGQCIFAGDRRFAVVDDRPFGRASKQ